MQTYIENLRSRPESYRKRILLGISVGVAVLLFLGFFSGLGTPIKEQKDSSSGPFSMMKNTFSQIFENVKSKEFLNQPDHDNKEDVQPKTETNDNSTIPFKEEVLLEASPSNLSEGFTN